MLGLSALLSLGVGCSAADVFDDDEVAAAGDGGSSSGGSSSGGRASSGAAGGTRDGSGMGGNASAGAGGSGGGASGDPNAEGESGLFVGMTAAHNVSRAGLGLPDLTWSTELAEFAQQWSDSLAGDQCGSIQHRDQNRYGENLAMRGSTRVGEGFSPEDAVAGWVAEEACWDFGTIQGSERCDTSCVQDLNSNGCGHYTQVVWRNTERVGCGYSTCERQGFRYEVWVCNYDPPGNFIGQAPY